MEHADERRTLPIELGENRPMNRVDELRGVDADDRRIRAHAAGVRAFVAVERPLEVLRSRQWNGVDTVAEREHRDLGAFEQLLDEERFAERSDGRQRGVELVLRPADEDSLARVITFFSLLICGW